MALTDWGAGRTRLESALLDQLGAAVVVTDPSGVVVECNRPAEDIYGRRREELVGAPSAGLGAEELETGVTAAVATELHPGRLWEGDLAIRRPDGSTVVVHAIDSALQGPGGELEGVVRVAVDITERSRAERHLAVQHGVARVLAEAETVEDAGGPLLQVVCEALGWQAGCLWELDPARQVVYCRKVWQSEAVTTNAFQLRSQRMTFPPGRGLPGRVWATRTPIWVPDVTADRNFPRAAAAAISGLHRGFAVPVSAGDEVLAVLEFLDREVEAPDEGLLAMMAALGSQIGQFLVRKRAEDATRASEARKTAILESALDAIVSMDHEGRVTDFNPAAERAFGYRRQEALGREMAELIIPPVLRGPHRRGLARYLVTGEGAVLGTRVETTGMRKDGTEFPVELAITRVDVPGPPSFTGYLRDITERLRAEQALRQSRARFADLANTLQSSLLPAHLPDVPGVELAVHYRPAYSGLEVGGDFYDVFDTGGDWAVVMGDVCGKGAEAASLTALVRYTVRAAAMQVRSPATILEQLNQAILRQRHDERFCTVAYARLVPTVRGKRVTVSSAGHPLPLVLRADGTVLDVGAPGTILGVFGDVRLLEETSELGPGDAMVFYTDGVPEARGAEEEFGDARLRAALAAGAGLDAAALVGRVVQAVLDFQGDRPVRDDIAVVVVRVPAGPA